MFEEVVELGHGEARWTLRASSPVPSRVPETSAPGQGTQVGRDGGECVDHAARAGERDASVGGTVTSVVDISSPELGLQKGTCSDEPLPDCGWAGSAVVRDVFDVGFAVLPECEKVRRG